jgi:hypothetical protein
VLLAITGLAGEEGCAQVSSMHSVVEYSRSTTDLDINGRSVGIRFGAATVGASIKGPGNTHLSAAYGQGYDPDVSASFLSIAANGPARSRMWELTSISPSLHLGPTSLTTGIAYRQQSANISLRGTDGEDPFTGRFDLLFRGLTPFVQSATPLPFGVQATARLGYQRWRIHYLASGELGRVRIRTESNVSAWGPNLSLGLTRSFGRMTWSLQGSAYRLDADNRVWVPGIRLGASMPY